MTYKRNLFYLFITLLLEFPAVAFGQPEPAVLEGTVVDEMTGKPLPFSSLYIIGIGQGAAADKAGNFAFNNLQSGIYTIRVTHVGYKMLKVEVAVKEGDNQFIKLKMKPIVKSINELTVTAENPLEASEIEGVSKSLSGSKLRRNMGTTLAATLQDMPGLAMRSLGAATARPVMRGLGGDRVTILQDGVHTSDVSALAADHAVTIDPMGAKKIEIARGPEALKYGSNAVKGVINVVSQQILTIMPDHVEGNAGIQGTTVNDGISPVLNFQIPAGPFAVQVNSNFKRSADLKTPIGKIPNTGIKSTDNAVGASYIQPWGYAGASFSYYLNHYGIPPMSQEDYGSGVNIKMRSYQFKGKSEIILHNDFLRSLKLDLSHINYQHKEFDWEGMTGTQYDLLTTSAKASLQHGKIGFIDNGTAGVWAQKSNSAILGGETPSTRSYHLSSYLVEDAAFNALTVKGGLRFDYIVRKPLTGEPQLSSDMAPDRSYAALSGSGSIIYSLNKNFDAGAVLFYSFRAPSSTELYSDGPDIGSYTYKKGDNAIKAERAFGKEIFVEFQSTNMTTKLSLYQNAFGNYIFQQNTGKAVPQDSRLTLYKYKEAEAQFYGVETSLRVKLSDHLQTSGSLSYTLARLRLKPVSRDNSELWGPLPKIPPLQGNIGLDYSKDGFRAGATARIAAKQARTGRHETATSGYFIFDLFGQYQIHTGQTLHTISIKGKNIFNSIYRNHLSQIKRILPEPGRNISLLYRVYF